MIKLFQASDLAALPNDKSFDVEHILNQRLYFEVANLSPYVFEVQEEDATRVRALVGAGAYVIFTIGERTAKYILHAVTTQSGYPILAAGYAVYCGVTRDAPPSITREAHPQ
ncbi:MAG TPA: hypothetical protein VKQ31_06120 [Steroidobacteraceae bacterium]|nr:hypothetical protein [Steroidobacteraceae bacterium]